jgi:hypothetical protein
VSQRISLTRVIALNWYGFRQIFEVDDNVLLSGAFGTGKSALLDLMQYVLLGEHWRANRAAAGNARGRDLVGYCLGDTNQFRNGQRHFLRQSGVTLVALEFTRPAVVGKEAQRETWGVRLEYSSPDAAAKQTYFFIPDRLEFADIAPDGKLFAEDAFRTWLRREYGNECLFPRQRDYLEEMAAPRHLNFDAAAFHRTFPKAIAFELEENIEKFIREFVLEESPLDVRDVRSALRAYDDTRKRLERQEDEAGYLRRICEQHSIYETSRREAAILAHTEHDLRLLQAEERRDTHSESLQRLEQDHAEDLKALERARTELADVETFLSDVRLEIQRDPAHVDFDRMHRQQRELKEAVAGLREAQKTARQRLDDRHYRWVQWLKHGSALPLEGLAELLAIDETLLARLRSGSDGERIDALPKLAQCFNEIWSAVRDLLRPLDDEIRSTGSLLQQLAADLENLSKGQAPGTFPLFQSVRHKLGDRVEQLGRLIEVRPEAENWWPALELYLGRNRWVLIVNDDHDYREALEILRRTPPGREPESLLHPGEVQSFRVSSRKGSLFEKIEVTHPIARIYAEHLLGEVICVETVEELERTSSSRAITPEGIYKQAPLRRRLKPATSVELTLGREGLERMRSAKLREQNETRARHETLRQRRGDVQTWLDIAQKGGLGDATLPDRASELPQLPKLESELGRVRETIDLLTTPEREARQRRLNELESKRTDVLSRRAVLGERNMTFEIRAKPIRDNLTRAKEDALKSRIDVEASRFDLSKQFSGILDAELLGRRNQLRAEFPTWSECSDAARIRAADAKERASLAREKRNNERLALANARDSQGNLSHPEYQHEYRADDESNETWAKRLRDLEEIELEKSRQLASDRKKDWERRLEENVLNELNRRINDAQNTIRLLDRYLSQPIGRFRYRITQRRDAAAYGAIWRLLDSGLEPTDPLAAAIQQSEVQQAKEELMKAVDAPDQGDDRARRILDYRNYHHYDLEMVLADKPDAAPISLNRSGRNLSGGESQAPFFISMLAAFRRVYDRGDRGSARSQQLGLVVMDEAFSKLSGDGIEDCLALARNFQLQLVMAFPPERLGVMVPHAQTVVMCQKEVELDAQGYFTRIDNIPLITTMAEAMEALS